MAKSIRSKIKKRLRTCKRQRVEAMVVDPRIKAQNEALTRTIEGRSVSLIKPRNAFKYPDDATSVFPQHEMMKPIDFRSSNLPMAGYAFRGNRRKYNEEEKAFMANLAKTSHPEMEVLAGGGAVLSSGKHVSVQEAEILATAAKDPDAVAAAVATSASASDAVAAALAADAPAQVAPADAAAGPASASVQVEPVPEPENAADHTRVPVVKDARRAKRTADHRPRSNNAVKKKGKEQPAEKPAGKAGKKKGKAGGGGDVEMAA